MPLLRDVIDALPELPLPVLCYRWANGRWSKHLHKETIPAGEVLLPTCISDLVAFSEPAARDQFEQLTQCFPNRYQAADIYGALWRVLRNMPCSDSTETVASLPIKYEQVWAKRLAQINRRAERKRIGQRRPASKVTSRRGSPGFELRYKPGEIEAADRKFFALRRSQKVLLQAMLAGGKERYSREELATLLRTSPAVTNVMDQDPWDVFSKARAILVRGGFIAALTPLQYAAQGVYLPTPPVRLRKTREVPNE